MIGANMRTEELLQQSQALTQELQRQSKELTAAAGRAQAHQRGAREAGDRAGGEGAAARRAEPKVEVKNREVELARVSLEEKAEQLALISKYKSEFLANMSHELRTPLNSLLILAKLLADNKEANLTDKQVEYAKTIYASGGDLLDADQRDPRPVQGRGRQDAGRAARRRRSPSVAGLRRAHASAPSPSRRASTFSIEVDRATCPARIRTDPQRLQQILKNLLANAFKFTERGSVHAAHAPARAGGRGSRTSAAHGGGVIAFAVADTGIGIAHEQAAAHLRGLPAGRRHHQPQVRRHRPRPVDQPRDRAPARRRDPRRERGRARGARSRSTCPSATSRPVDDDGDREPQLRRRARSSFAQRGQRRRRSPSPIRSSLARSRTIATDIARGRPRAAHHRGRREVRAHHAADGARQGLQGRGRHARRHRPRAGQRATGRTPSRSTSSCPALDGWTVLDRLKRNPRRGTSRCTSSRSTRRSRRGAALGAFAYLEKPVSREALDGAFAHIDDLPRPQRCGGCCWSRTTTPQRDSIVELVGEGERRARSPRSRTGRGGAGGARQRRVRLHGRRPGAARRRRHPADRAGAEPQVRQLRELPIIVYTGKDLTPEDEDALKKYAAVGHPQEHGALARAPAQRDRAVPAPRREHACPSDRKAVLRGQPAQRRSVAGRKVLVVDDDVRNIFAMTSVLEASGLRGDLRRERPGRHRGARRATRTSTSC